LSITWEESEELAADRAGWRQNVVQCPLPCSFWTHVKYFLCRSVSLSM